MSNAVAFVSRLVSDLIEMPRIFVQDVMLSDPLSAISVLFGSLFVGIAVVGFGYLVVGALIQLLTGGGLPAIGSGRVE